MTALGRIAQFKAGRSLDRRDWAEVVLLALLGGLCAYGVHRVFGSTLAPLRVAAAAALSVLLIAVLEYRRPSLWLTGAISLVAMLAYTAYSQLTSTMPIGIPGLATLRALWDGLYSGWADGLDALFPLPASGSTSVLMTYLAWIAGSAAALLMLRARHVVWPLAPLFGLYAITLPLAAPAPSSGIWLPLAIAGVGLLVVALRANQRRSTEVTHGLEFDDTSSTDTPESIALLDGDFQTRTTTLALARSALPVAVACVAIGGLIGTLLAFRSDDPVDPRSLRPDVVSPEAVINPLAEFKAVRAQNPPVPALSLELLGENDREILRRVPVAVLDAYDGAEWRSTARYRLSDSDLDTRSGSEENTALITQTIAVGTLRGPWLPAAQRPVWVSIPEVMFDKAAGSIIAPEGTTVSTYTVTSRLPVASDELLQGADLGDVDDSYVALPDQVSADIIDLATNVASKFDNPYDITTALVEFLQDEVALKVDSPPGHSLGRLRAFLVEDQRGGPEQFATALAVMLRTQQIPARVVIGFDLAEVADTNGDASLDITSEHYDVWVEVPFDGFGWQAFDPAPIEIAAEELPEETPGTTIPAAPTAVATPQAQPTEGSPSEAIDTDEDPNGRNLGAWVFPSLIGLLFAVGLLAVVLYVMVSKRRRRKRRRSAPTPVGRIEGAWADATDRLLEGGVEVTPELTFTEVAALSDEEFGADASRALRALVPDVAANAFAPVQPDATTAERAWKHADAYRADTARSRPPLKRVGEKLSPRPLVKNR